MRKAVNHRNIEIYRRDTNNIYLYIYVCVSMKIKLNGKLELGFSK